MALPVIWSFVLISFIVSFYFFPSGLARLISHLYSNSVYTRQCFLNFSFYHASQTEHIFWLKSIQINFNPTLGKFSHCICYIIPKTVIQELEQEDLPQSQQKCNCLIFSYSSISLCLNRLLGMLCREPWIQSSGSIFPISIPAFDLMSMKIFMDVHNTFF